MWNKDVFISVSTCETTKAKRVGFISNTIHLFPRNTLEIWNTLFAKCRLENIWQTLSKICRIEAMFNLTAIFRILWFSRPHIVNKVTIYYTNDTVHLMVGKNVVIQLFSANITRPVHVRLNFTTYDTNTRAILLNKGLKSIYFIHQSKQREASA